MIKKRGTWLTVLLVGEMLTATALGFFEADIQRAAVLTLFIPLIISSGGNSGSQASTLVIRAMALGEVRAADWWRVMRRELATGLALGAILGAIGTLRVVLWGTADRVNPATGAMALQARMPACDAYLFSRTGHWVQWERADEFNAVVTAFLSVTA